LVTRFLAIGGSFSQEQLMILLLSMAVLLGLARFLGELARQLRQPAILGEILAGVVMGPTFLGWVWPGAYGWLFPTEGPVPIAIEAMFNISVVLLLLVAGMEVDLASVRRQGRSVIFISVTSIVIPFALGFALAWYAPRALGMYEIYSESNHMAFSLFIGLALAISALPVIAKVLIDLNLAKTDFGSLVMSAAIVDDLVGWMIFATILATVDPVASTAASDAVKGVANTAVEIVRHVGLSSKPNGSTGSGLAVTILLTLSYSVVVLTIGRYLFDKTLLYAQAYIRGFGGILGFILVVAFCGAAFTQYIGIHSLFGAFMVGVAIGNSHFLRQKTRDAIHQFVAYFFAPLFMVSIGLRVDFISSFSWVPVLTVLVLAISGKMVGAYISAAWSGIERRENLALCFAMTARGAMEVILGKLALQMGLITESVFVPIVIMAVVTSLIAGPAIEYLLKPRRQQLHRLSDYLKQSHFIHTMKSNSAYDAIKELCTRASHIMGAHPVQTMADAMTESIWSRQSGSRDGIQGELSVTSATFEGITRPIVVLGRSMNGIDFNAADGQHARVLCLVVLPTNSRSVDESQAKMVSLINQTFSTSETRSKTLKAKNYRELVAVLNSGSIDQVD
jgi:Kef-type K+ transport system membrane component KefB/mannitol/fructose-specific phosphotransferase system IIA component (Ntr-type)